MFPIFDKYGKVIGFSGRDISGKKDISKYINTPDTALYKKENVLYGFHFAHKYIRQSGIAYLVEGNPDVIKLQSIDITNSVATSGTSLTKNHILELKKYCKTIKIIGDSDAEGQKAVTRSAELIIHEGLTCSIITLPIDGKKSDPDSFFTDIDQFKEYESKNTEDFIFWKAEKDKEKLKNNPTAKYELIKHLCELLYHLEIGLQDAYIENLAKILPTKKLWKDEIKRIYDDEVIEEDKGFKIPSTVKLEDYEKWHFYVDNNEYWFKGKNGPEKGSNFVLEPLFHAESMVNSKRLFKIKNSSGYERFIELSQQDLVSISQFRVRIESIGNFIWYGNEYHLIRLKGFLYSSTMTCQEITQLGWQRHGFFAWGNGIYNGEFLQVNELGIVGHDDRYYYIPSFSSIYKNEESLFIFERKFIHMKGEITIKDYSSRLLKVFGEQASIALCFYFATLFRDFLFRKFNFFPILNLFGPKGAGKTELAHSLIRFFGRLPVGPNINSTSKPALADHVSCVCNAIVHIDEYKNNMEFEKIEFLKALWNGTGRTKMNMDKDKKKETTAVDSGVVITGQEMPTADIALFTRLIYLTFHKCEFTDDEKHEFDELKVIERKGLTHITEKILSLRKYFIEHYDEFYESTTELVNKKLGDIVLEDRIYKNWMMVISAYATISEFIEVSFDLKYVINVTAKLLANQNSETKIGNEISVFWNIVEYLAREGFIEEGYDYKFDIADQVIPITTDKVTDKLFPKTTNIILINHSRIIPLYRKHGIQMKENILPTKTLEYYLTNDKAYLGRKHAVSFKVKQDKEIEKPQTAFDSASTTREHARVVTKAMAFIYDSLNIDLMTSTHDKI
jgi:DNA primase